MQRLRDKIEKSCGIRWMSLTLGREVWGLFAETFTISGCFIAQDDYDNTFIYIYNNKIIIKYLNCKESLTCEI